MQPLEASNGTTLSHSLMPLKMNAQFIGKPFQSWLLESSGFDGTNRNSVFLHHGNTSTFPSCSKMDKQLHDQTQTYYLVQGGGS